MSDSCPYCGMTHKAICPRVRSIEYADDGVTIRRVEFHAPTPFTFAPLPPGSYRYVTPGVPISANTGD